ncbi:hypothetical protein LBMAG34_4520 [Candidatus Saccharibacteria bacterium]|nr:hypothetical protein LBMAG34_4520 [Candidatus Saccharibacteria bacterium]
MFKYSFLIIMLLFIAFFVGYIYKLKLNLNKAWRYTALISFVAMIIFNTYLTALPIVVYNVNSILGIKILTFPIEDIGYLIMVLLLLPPLFEKLSDEKRDHPQKPTKH